MATIKIMRESEGGPITFDPNPLTLVSGDFVCFANHDKWGEHQPAPVGQPAATWMNDALPRFQEGEPAATSPAISLSGTTAKPIDYYDGIEPNSPTGTITF